MPDDEEKHPDPPQEDGGEPGGGEPEKDPAEPGDRFRPEAIAARVDHIGDETDLDRVARQEEQKLLERKRTQKKKGGLEAAASKRLAKIGEGNVRRPGAFGDVTPDADPLVARATRATSWIKEHQQTFVGLVAVVVLAGAGLAGYSYWQDKRNGEASTLLAQALADQHGHVSDKTDDDDDDDAKPRQLYPTFKTAGERRDAALAKYRDVEAKFPGTGAAILARLAEGSLLLDAGDTKGAIDAYTGVKDSALGQADAEVRGRALEGIGFADELLAQKDDANRDKHLSDALTEFEALEHVDVDGFKELGQYHQARVQQAKGDKAKAIELLKDVQKRVSEPGEGHPFSYLQFVVEDRLRELESHGAPAEGGEEHARRARRRRRERSEGAAAHRAATPAGQAAQRRPGEAAAGRASAARSRSARARGGTAVTVPRLALVAGAFASGVFALATGCGSLDTGNDRVNPEVPLWLHRPSGAMHVLFTRTLTADSKTSGEPYERGRPEIDPASGRVFVGSSDHGLYAVRATNGSTLWRFETMAAVQSEPLYDPALDTVYFGSNDGALYAVHASDGKLIWRYSSGAEVARRPVLDGERLYFANAADNLFAIDRRTGATFWHVHRTPALGMEISGYSGPALDHGTIFFAFSDGHVGAYDAANGNERWTPVDLSAEAEQTQGGEALRYLDVDTTPIPDDLGAQGHVIFVGSYAGGVYALDQDRGAPVWKDEKVTGVTDLALWRERAHTPRVSAAATLSGLPEDLAPASVPAREILLASSGATGLWALDPATGKTIWRIAIPVGGVTAPAAVAGALLVGTTNYGAFLISPRNGAPIDGFDLGSGFSQAPATYGTRGYVLSNAGTLVAVQVEPPEREEASNAGCPW